ncbi:MAG: hypothetical protein Q8Q59_05165 [Luteolibacter sp.]|jgi:hypothetical protein|nr:hypothetical protein [Luteolibacter sp.]
MKLRQFVSASAAVLLVWLAVTFVHQVPAQRYPKLDKYPTTGRRAAPENTEATPHAADPAVLQVSVSH